MCGSAWHQKRKVQIDKALKLDSPNLKVVVINYAGMMGEKYKDYHMRNSVKLLPVLLLGSVLGGCSMAGTGDFFVDEYAGSQSWGQTGHATQSSCWQPQVVTQPQVLAQPAQTNCGQANVIQPNFVPNFAHTVPQAPIAQPNFAQPNFVQPNFAQPSFAQPNFAQPNFAQAPIAQAPIAQPTFVQPGFVQPGNFQGAFVPPTVGVNANGLRGQSIASDNYFYGTLGGINYDLGEDIYGIQGRLGYQFNRFLGAEVEGSFGVVDDTDELTLAGGAIVDQEIDIDTSIAGFGVVRYPLFGRLSGLSRVGYHRTNVGIEFTDAAGVEVEDDFNTDGLAFGTGVEYAFDPQTSVRLDYTRYDFDGPNADSLALAIARKF